MNKLQEGCLELLAPARDAAVARTAIACGADAIYIGAPAFGARAAATNSIADIAALSDYAHRFGVRVYVTMNTLLLESELEEARRTVIQLYNAGVDALIVQDMAYLMMDIPPIALHASTQCDIRTPAKAMRLQQAGFSQLVLPREFSPAQIRRVADTVSVPVEVFIHGARCVSYSGDCQMGYVATGRSGNRGVCPQMCRLPFDLVDAGGRPLGPRRHYLSLSDMITPDIAVLAHAGARSFKIEGRLKDQRYVANATAAYSAALNALVASEPERWHRSSRGRSIPGFVPDLNKEFFRRPNGGGIQATLASPKDTGAPLAQVSAVDSRRSFRIKGANLTNGDGLGFFTPDGEFHGFRLNKSEGDKAFSASDLENLKPGATIYRNYDKAFSDALDRARPRRTIPVDFTLGLTGNTLTLTASSNGISVSVAEGAEASAAKTPQNQVRLRAMERLGDTIFELGAFRDLPDNVFVPASILGKLRRRAIEELEKALADSHTRDTRAASALPADAYAAEAPLSYHDNCANSLARKFYTSHGAAIAQPALETGRIPPGEIRVMQTRYCIRAELGACLRSTNASLLPDDIFLKNESGTYRLRFDCTRCGMDISRLPGS